MSYKKEKGKKLESWVEKEIITRGLDDRAIRDGASGASFKEKRDVNTNVEICGRLMGIECKNQKQARVKSWWKQTQKLEQLEYEPVLIYKLFGESMEDSKAVIYVTTLLDLIANQAGGELDTGIPRSDQWKVKRAIENLKSLLKVLKKYEK